MQSIIVVLPISTYFSQHLSKLLITTIKNFSFPTRCIIIGSDILVKMFLQRCLKVPCSLAAPWVVVTFGAFQRRLTLPVPASAALLRAGGTALRAGNIRGLPAWSPHGLGDTQGKARAECCQSTQAGVLWSFWLCSLVRWNCYLQ